MASTSAASKDHFLEAFDTLSCLSKISFQKFIFFAKFIYVYFDFHI